MGWFGPKLEPGERELTRSRLPVAAVWPPALMLFGMILAATGFMAHSAPAEPVDQLELLLGELAALLALWGAIILMFRKLVDGWVITDRRVIRLRGALRRVSDVMELDHIEKADFERERLVLHGGGGEISLSLGPVSLARLQESLGRWGPPDGTAVQPLDRMLEQGEVELARNPSKSIRIVVLFIFLFGGLAVAAMAGLAIAKGMGLLGFLPASGFTLIALGNGITSFTFAFRWHAIVTDRRLFVRRPYDPAWCDLWQLSQIDSVENSVNKYLLEVRANGKTVAAIAKYPGAKERINAAIEAAKGAK